MIRLHLGCGDVYLEGYVNLDICGEITADNPNITTYENYYKQSFDSDNRQKKIVVDGHIDLTKPWDIKDNFVDEIVMVCVIEHFTLDEAKHIFKEAERILKKGGVFKFDFPDISTTINEYWDNPEFMMRLIYGTHKNPYSVHKFGYTRSLIIKLLGNGWDDVIFGDIVKHAYPMQGVMAIK